MKSNHQVDISMYKMNHNLPYHNRIDINMDMHIDVDKKQFTSWQEFLSWKAIEEKNNYVCFSQLKGKYKFDNGASEGQ